MTRSMTAFARQEQHGVWGRLVWELRSVNHRYLDIHPRLPEELRVLETPLRERLDARLDRGKVECTLRYRPAPGAEGGGRINWACAEQLLSACGELRARVPQAAPISLLELLRMPGVLQDPEPDLEPVMTAALALLEAAADELVATRAREGARLAGMVRERVRMVGRLTEQVRDRREEVNAQVRQRLLARLRDVGIDADPGRLEQELVLLAQKMDVEEELGRLLAHVAEVERVLGTDGPAGRRLDFLMQELNREANTLGAKSGDAETTRMSVEMKVLIEQMREQVQNIE